MQVSGLQTQHVTKQIPKSARTQPILRSSSSNSMKDIKSINKNNIIYPPNEKTILMNQNKNIENALKQKKNADIRKSELTQRPVFNPNFHKLFNDAVQKLEVNRNNKRFKDLDKILKNYQKQNLDLKTQEMFMKIPDILEIRKRINGVLDLNNLLHEYIQFFHQIKKSKKQQSGKNSDQNQDEFSEKLRTKQLTDVERKISFFQNHSNLINQIQMIGDSKEEESEKLRHPLPCLSIIFIKLEDIFHYKVIENIPREYLFEINILIKICFFIQKCLIYKLPFLVTNILMCKRLFYQSDVLEYLKMMTKNGQVVNQAISQKIFVIIIDLIEEQAMNEEQEFRLLEDVMSFLYDIIDLSPQCFNHTHIMILMTKICLLPFKNQGFYKFQIIQHCIQIINSLLKYQDSLASQNLSIIGLMALTLLVTDKNDEIKQKSSAVFQIFALIDPNRIVFELIDFLCINQDQNKQIERYKIKCFNQESNDYEQELQEFVYNLETNHRSCMKLFFEEIEFDLTLEELMCRLKCSQKSYNQEQYQFFDIVKIDNNQFQYFKEGKENNLLRMIEVFQKDREEFLAIIDKNYDKMIKGAIQFLSIFNFGPDTIVENFHFSNFKILEVFTKILQTQFKEKEVIKEIVQSINKFIENEQNINDFEWDAIFDIIDILFNTHFIQLQTQDLLMDVDKIFQKAVDEIMSNNQDVDEQRVLNQYYRSRVLYMSKIKSFTEKQLYINQVEFQSFGDIQENNIIGNDIQTNEYIQIIQNYNKLKFIAPRMPNPQIMTLAKVIDFQIYNYQFIEGDTQKQGIFVSNFQDLFKNLFINEVSIEVKILFLQKMHQFYLESLTDLSICQFLEQTFLIITTDEYNFILQQKVSDQSMNKSDKNIKFPIISIQNVKTNQQIWTKLIDIMALMINKTADLQICQLMLECLKKIIFGQNKLLVFQPSDLQRFALFRITQLFKIHAQQIDLLEKAVKIYNILIDIFQNGSLWARNVILNDIMINFRINKTGQLCWSNYQLPLLIGFTEYCLVNTCKLCYQLIAREDPNQKEENDKIADDAIAISLHNLLIILSNQLVLEDKKALDYKKGILKMISNLIFDVMQSEDSCHQKVHQMEIINLMNSKNDQGLLQKVIKQNFIQLEQQMCINDWLRMSLIAQNLMQKINFDESFQCSELIVEILSHIILSQSKIKNDLRQAFINSDIQDFQIRKCESTCSLLQLTAQVQKDLIQRITYLTFYNIKSLTQKLKQLKKIDLLQNSQHELHNSQIEQENTNQQFQESLRSRRKMTQGQKPNENLPKTLNELKSQKEMTYNPLAIQNYFDINYCENKIQRLLLEESKHITLFQRLLSILSQIYKTKSLFYILVEMINQNQIFPEISEKLENDDCMFMFVQTLYTAVNCDEIINLISFQVVGSVEGIIQFLEYARSKNKAFIPQYPQTNPNNLIQLCDTAGNEDVKIISVYFQISNKALFYILLKTAMPKQIQNKRKFQHYLQFQMEACKQQKPSYDFKMKQYFDEFSLNEDVLTEFLDFKNNQSFQKYVQNFENKFSYFNSVQSQILLNRITSSFVNLFKFQADFNSFLRIQKYLSFLKNQIKTQKNQFIKMQDINQIYNYTKEEKPLLTNQQQFYDYFINQKVNMEQIFLINLIDFLNWNFNQLNGPVIKRHLPMINQNINDNQMSDAYKESMKIQFYVLNDSLVEIKKDSAAQSKFTITIRNSCFNQRIDYDIRNQLQPSKQSDWEKITRQTNRQKMQQIINNEQNQIEPIEKSDDNEISQEILFQILGASITNSMKKKSVLLKVEGSNHGKCREACNQLDSIVPYNLSYIFVTSLYADSLTVLDFLSRLGDLKPNLHQFKHYFTCQPRNVQDYISSIKGIVYEFQDTELFVFFSDFIQQDIDFQILQQISNLQIIFIGSLQNLALKENKIINQENSKQLIKENYYRQGKALKIFQLNNSSYLVSDDLQSKGILEIEQLEDLIKQQDLYQKIISDDGEEKNEEQIFEQNLMIIEKSLDSDLGSYENQMRREVLLKQPTYFKKGLYFQEDQRDNSYQHQNLKLLTLDYQTSKEPQSLKSRDYFNENRFVFPNSQLDQILSQNFLQIAPDVQIIFQSSKESQQFLKWQIENQQNNNLDHLYQLQDKIKAAKIQGDPQNQQNDQSNFWSYAVIQNNIVAENIRQFVRERQDFNSQFTYEKYNLESDRDVNIKHNFQFNAPNQLKRGIIIYELLNYIKEVS